MTWRAPRATMTAGVVLAGVVAFVAGRLTAPDRATGPVRDGAGSYAAGVAAGEALGVREGRALQEASQLRPDARRPVQDAFDAGYAAGVNDVFSGYDGGWRLGAPYVITLAPGSGGATYRILSRTELQPGATYALCPDGRTVCAG